MRKPFLLFLFSFSSFATSINPPSEWVKGFWFGYKTGEQKALNELNKLQQVLIIKEQILNSKIPPIYIENGKCKVLDKSFLQKFSVKTLPSGYYAVIDTSELTTPQKYYLMQKLMENGFIVYDKGSLYVGSYPTEDDARAIAKTIERRYQISTYIVKVK